MNEKNQMNCHNPVDHGIAVTQLRTGEWGVCCLQAL